jgi:hypothetical protein
MTQVTTDPHQTLLQRHLIDWQIQLQTWALSGALLDAASRAQRHNYKKRLQEARKTHPEWSETIEEIAGQYLN